MTPSRSGTFATLSISPYNHLSIFSICLPVIFSASTCVRLFCTSIRLPICTYVICVLLSICLFVHLSVLFLSVREWKVKTNYCCVPIDFPACKWLYICLWKCENEENKTWAQFHQLSMYTFYASRSQKCKKILTTWLSYYALGSYGHKRCT